MGRHNTLINILIILEVIALVIVLGLSAVSTLASGGSFRSSSSSEGDIEQTSGDADSSADADDTAAVNDTAAEEDASQDAVTADVSETYEEDRLTFDDAVQELLTSLTTEQLVAQLFITTPEELTGVDGVTVAGDGTQSALEAYPVSGLLYSAQNFSSMSQTQELLEGTQAYAQEIIGIDMLLLAEELGGDSASPVASANGYEVQASPASLAADGDPDAAGDAASAIAAYLLEKGFTAVFGPMADASDAETSYGTDTQEAADYVSAAVAAFQDGGISAVLRAFPGTDEAADDYSVFEAAIEAGADIIQVGNVTASSLTGDETSLASLSAGTVTSLRSGLGYTGVIMTDDLSAYSVTTAGYSVGEAAVKALQSGMNLLYVTDGFTDAYDAVLSAVNSGEISDTMLENAVGRILSVKLQ